MKAKVTDAVAFAVHWRSSFVGSAISLLPLSMLLVCAFGSATGSDAANDYEPFELTQVDLFSQPNWEQRRATIEGIFLGMTREKAIEAATAHGLVLIEERNLRKEACCEAAEVYQATGKYHGHGNPIGLRLYFDAENRVSKMSLNFAEAMDPDVAAVNITRKFKGVTSRLFAHYSDSLRQQIFGSARGKERARSTVPNDTDVVIEYDYPQSGVTLWIMADEGKKTPDVREVALDFYERQ